MGASTHRFFAKAACAVASVCSFFGGASLHAAPPPATVGAEASNAYVGSAVCARCHAAQHEKWQGSLHAWAMKPVVPNSVASLDQSRIPWNDGSSAKVVRTGEGVAVEIRPPSDVVERHTLRYLLGHGSIEQHLTDLPNGRLQALPSGYDVRRGDWFDIFEGDVREQGDWGHWKGLGMTANSQCLYCHTTDYRKRYDPGSDSYDSKWAEMGVGCESCHGPGAQHAASPSPSSPYQPASGERLLDVCSTCHALRRQIAEGFAPGDHLLDFFEPNLLDGDTYHPDGQIDDEAYEGTSFLQSRMYREGVKCGDCHDAHSGELKAAGDALCLSCHDRKYADQAHTHHAASASVGCAACHMPQKTFMARDRRFDHSFSIPDPQATVELGVPNACNACHTDHDAAWAASNAKGWYRDPASMAARRRFATAFKAGRERDPASIAALLECAKTCSDRVRRASALKLLAPFSEEQSALDAILAAASAEDSLIRNAAVWALAEGGATRPAVRDLLAAAAADRLRAVRLNAAWGLRKTPLAELSAGRRAAVEAAFVEWEKSSLTEAEHAETEHTRGVFFADRGRTDDALSAYGRAIRLAPTNLPSRYNLAMLYARLERKEQTTTELQELMKLDESFAPAGYALGLLYVDDEKWEEAIAALSACLKADPLYPGALHNLSHAYVKIGRRDIADRVLTAALDYPGARTEALVSLVAVHEELGEHDQARHWAETATREDQRLAAHPVIRRALATKQ